ncbi:MAG: hypothetical protein QE278_07060 [Limnobacter sp.]|nr:hypothetical protein [Limnobacter sp.]
MKPFLNCIAALLVLSSLPGCAIVSGTVGAAVSVTGAVAGAAIRTTGAVIGAGIDAVAGDDDDD